MNAIVVRLFIMSFDIGGPHFSLWAKTSFAATIQFNAIDYEHYFYLGYVNPNEILWSFFLSLGIIGIESVKRNDFSDTSTKNMQIMLTRLSLWQPL